MHLLGDPMDPSSADPGRDSRNKQRFHHRLDPIRDDLRQRLTSEEQSTTLIAQHLCLEIARYRVARTLTSYSPESQIDRARKEAENIFGEAAKLMLERSEAAKAQGEDFPISNFTDYLQGVLREEMELARAAGIELQPFELDREAIAEQVREDPPST